MEALARQYAYRARAELRAPLCDCTARRLVRRRGPVAFQWNGDGEVQVDIKFTFKHFSVASSFFSVYFVVEALENQKGGVR